MLFIPVILLYSFFWIPESLALVPAYGKRVAHPVPQNPAAQARNGADISALSQQFAQLGNEIATNGLTPAIQQQFVELNKQVGTTGNTGNVVNTGSTGNAGNAGSTNSKSETGNTNNNANAGNVGDYGNTGNSSSVSNTGNAGTTGTTDPPPITGNTAEAGNGTSNAAGGPSSFEGQTLKVTVTTYQACGSVPGGCGFAASGRFGTGALSAYLQTKNAYCGSCWQFVSAQTIQGSDAQHTLKDVTFTQPLVVMISNTCGRDDSPGIDEIPPQVGNGVGLCNQNATFPVSKYDAVSDLDLCADTDAATMWQQMSGGGTGIATIKNVPCTAQNWAGTIDHTAPWCSYKSGPGLAPLRPGTSKCDPGSPP